MFSRKHDPGGAMILLSVIFCFAVSLVCSFAQQKSPLLSAEELYKQGNFIEAVRVLNGYITSIEDVAVQKKNYARANFLLAKIYFEAGEDRRVEEYLHKAVRADPEVGKDDAIFATLLEKYPLAALAPAKQSSMPKDNTVSWYLKRGDEFFASGNYSQAIEQYRLAWRLDPDDPVAPKKITLCDEKIELNEQKLEMKAQEQKFNEYLERADGDISRGQAAFALQYLLAARKLLHQNDKEIAVRLKKIFESDKGAWEQFCSEHGVEWSRLFCKYYGPPLPDFEMVKIPAGSFMMGSETSSNEGPVHKMQISSFYLGKTEVTQGLWQALMGDNPANFRKGDDYPVEQVNWDEVQEFIIRLNERTGQHFRLPSEAEWEYACRATTTGEQYGKLDAVAWYDGNSGKSTHPVGQKRPNAFGLYDMLGNVWEWCQDWYDSGYYKKSPLQDLQGPQKGVDRVGRGGSWSSNSLFVRSAYRYSRNPGYRDGNLGFRLVRTDG